MRSSTITIALVCVSFCMQISLQPTDGNNKIIVWHWLEPRFSLCSLGWMVCFCLQSIDLSLCCARPRSNEQNKKQPTFRLTQVSLYSRHTDYDHMNQFASCGWRDYDIVRNGIAANLDKHILSRTTAQLIPSICFVSLPAICEAGVLLSLMEMEEKRGMALPRENLTKKPRLTS